jgi:glycerol-1-phosphate dehydrogenase [NAD(P)+]
MVYKQIAYIPIIFQVDEGILLNISDFLQRNNLYFNKVLIVSGKSHSYNYAIQLIKLNGWENFQIEDNTYEEVERVKKFCETNRYELIVAIGGGKVLDTIKRVSYLTNINHLSIPTIISNDGLISPIAVIKNKDGKTESSAGMSPMGVIIDLDIIEKSPINYLRAAAGDILSNLSATNDWILACKEKKDKINDIGFHLSKSAANALIHFNKINLSYKPFVRMIVQGQINSGFAMSLAGSSRPCSGSEHLLSHAIDFLGLSEKVLHGIQVASISLFMLFLQKKLTDIHIKYALAINIPLNFTDLITNKEHCVIRKIYSKAKEMRPGRITVLDFIDEDQFIDNLIKYTAFVKTI